MGFVHVEGLSHMGGDSIRNGARKDLHSRLWDIGELDAEVGIFEYCLGDVLPYLEAVDLEGGDELDVLDVVAAEVDVHKAGDLPFLLVPVELHSLDEG